MTERDDAAAAYYSDPAHRMSEGQGYALPGRPARLSGHVPIRFDRNTIAAIKLFSDEDGMTVSAWVRKVVDREIRRLDPTGVPDGPGCQHKEEGRTG